MGDSGNSFLAFAAKRRRDLQRIARNSEGDHTLEDIANEAWLIAERISRKRGRPVDFADEEDQETVLAWLYRETVTFAEKCLRYAMELDRGADTDDAEGAHNPLIDTLAAPKDYDPFERMQSKQDYLELLDAIADSYSQFAAYVVLLYRSDWDMDHLADTIRLTVATLHKRIVAAYAHMHRQPSLFDRLLRIDRLFEPMVQRPAGRRVVTDSTQKQLAWEFV